MKKRKSASSNPIRFRMRTPCDLPTRHGTVKQSRIQAVDHVNLEALRGVEEALRWFYGEIAELDDITEANGDASILRFRSERIEVRIRIVGEPAIDPVRYRVTIVVPNLDETAERLLEAGSEIERISGLMWSDRQIATFDPAGHRIILKQHWPTGPL